MLQKKILCFLMLGILVFYFQPVKANISGKVSNKSGKPIANATCSLVVKGIKVTTGSDGSYLLTTTGVSFNSLLVSPKASILLRRNFLDFTVPKSSTLKIDFFDVKGSLIRREVVKNVQPGAYRVNIAENFNTANLFLIKVSVGENKAIFKYVPGNLKNIFTSSDEIKSVSSDFSNSAKIMAIIDTLKVSATNYMSKDIPITSYDTTVDVTLDTLDESGVTVRLDMEKQPFVGFGINATIMPSGKSLPWDQLFSTDLTKKDALGLSILRIGMNESGDHRDVPSNWTDVRKINPDVKVIGSCWSAPGDWKVNHNSLNGGGHLSSNRYKDWATRIADYAKKYNLYAMSVANESDFASCDPQFNRPCNPPLTDPYPSMEYTAKEMVEFIKVAGPIIRQRAPDVKIIAPEASVWLHVWSNLSPTQKAAGYYNSSDPLGCGCFSNDENDSAALAQCAKKCLEGDGYDYGHWLAKDTAAWNSFDILGVHEYETQRAHPWPKDVTGGKRTKEVWQTEMSGVMYWPEQGPSTSIENGVAVARWIQSAIMVGEVSAWCYWWYEAYYQNDNEGLALIKGSSNIAKRYYTFGNYSRYIRPGHKIVEITGTKNLPQKVLLTASKDPNSGKVVIVAVNETTSAQTVQVKIAGGKVPASFKPIVTNSSVNWKEGTPVSVSDGVLTMQLEKMSVTTFVGE